MRPKNQLPSLLVALATVIVASAADAVVLLSTGFSGRTVAGKTANTITWTSSGLSAPGSLTAVDEAPANASFAALFDTASADGHFAPDKNIGNEGPWSVSVAVALTSPTVSLESIDIDWQHFDNNGNFQSAVRGVKWTITVTGSTSGLLANGTVDGTASGTSGLNNLAFVSPLNLNNSETYNVRFFVENSGNTIGNNTGFDGLVFNGTVVPEPGSALLVAVALGTSLLSRRRR